MSETPPIPYLVSSISGWVATLTLPPDVAEGIAQGDAAAQAYVAEHFRETIIEERGSDPGMISPAQLELRRA